MPATGSADAVADTVLSHADDRCVAADTVPLPSPDGPRRRSPALSRGRSPVVAGDRAGRCRRAIAGAAAGRADPGAPGRRRSGRGRPASDRPPLDDAAPPASPTPPRQAPPASPTPPAAPYHPACRPRLPDRRRAGAPVTGPVLIGRNPLAAAHPAPWRAGAPRGPVAARGRLGHPPRAPARGLPPRRDRPELDQRHDRAQLLRYPSDAIGRVHRRRARHQPRPRRRYDHRDPPRPAAPLE